MLRSHRWLILLSTLGVMIAAWAEEAPLDASNKPPSSLVVGIQGTRFTINQRPEFLLGCSYYGALGASEDFIRQDLDDLRELGFNWVRVWATWGAFDHNISAFDNRGRIRQPYFSKLQWLVEECDARGMVVDVTLARHQASRGSAVPGLIPDFEAHRNAVEALVIELKGSRNWYLDLANERDVGDARYVPVEELKQLRDAVRILDADRLVTASFGGHDLSEEDIRDMVVKVGVDFLAPHRPRHVSSPSETEAHTRRCLETMRSLGRVVPVHYQEPFRRGYQRWEPKAEDFLADLEGAKRGGAAGWCFHNGTQRNAEDEKPRRSFDLRNERLMDQWDREERRFLEMLK